MNYADFSVEFPAEFREAFGDLDMREIGKLLDKYDLTEIGRLVFNNIEAAKKSVEDDMTPGGEYGEEKRLDDKHRTEECNR